MLVEAVSVVTAMAIWPSDQEASGRSFGETELDRLRDVIESGILFGPKGTYVKMLEREFASWSGHRHAIACSSGTSALHTALAALDVGPGDEVITTGVTDIGALTPILYQGAIPVFADVDPTNGNLTATSVERRLSERTRVIVVTHLLGNPADILGIGNLGAARGLPVIEDCAQAFGATVGGHKVGTFGQIAGFSLQQGKHITSGEGGLAVTDDEQLAHHSRLFVNKAWDYDAPSDHDFLALNYRMTELQGAVATAQLESVEENIAARRSNAELLRQHLSSLPGIEFTSSANDAESSYWRVGLLVDPEIVPGGTDALGERLRTVGVPAASRYIKKPAFQTRLFTEQKTLGDSRWPFTLASPDAVDYSVDRFPGTFEFLRTILVIPWNERLTTEHVTRLAEAIETAVTDMAAAPA